jgi:hypothetical protein
VATCPNGHPVSPGDIICPVCNVDLEQISPPNGSPGTPVEPEVPPEPIVEATRIAGWEIIRRIDVQNSTAECFLVTRTSDPAQGLLTLYPSSLRPASQIYEAVRAFAPRPAATILATGEHEGRFFEVAEAPEHGTFATLPLDPTNAEQIRNVVREIGGAVSALGNAGIRHRDLRPDAILIRHPNFLEITISRFGATRLSTHDLDTAPPFELSRYMAPEALAGAIASASDWWSLGIVILEKLTGGACFEGISDQAFLMHVVASGAEIPTEFSDELRLLLRGLLTRDAIALIAGNGPRFRPG